MIALKQVMNHPTLIHYLTIVSNFLKIVLKILQNSIIIILKGSRKTELVFLVSREIVKYYEITLLEIRCFKLDITKLLGWCGHSDI